MCVRCWLLDVVLCDPACARGCVIRVCVCTRASVVCCRCCAGAATAVVAGVRAQWCCGDGGVIVVSDQVAVDVGIVLLIGFFGALGRAVPLRR